MPKTKSHPIPRPTWPVLRTLAVEFQIDPRTILREWDSPGSGRGLSAQRAKEAIAKYKKDFQSDKNLPW